jgi:transcription elongation factor Elf1
MIENKHAPSGPSIALLPGTVREGITALHSHWRNSAHLIRLGAVMLVFVAVFAVIRQFLVPKTFGEYGHFRGAVLEELRAAEPVFAGQETCAGCHDEVVQVKAKGRHGGVSCEACHGPQAKHAAEMSEKPQRLEPVALCSRCHEANSAKPKGFPQVATREHSGGESCLTCHKSHQPKVGN